MSNPTSESQTPETETDTGATFALAADDPRRTENRGGLEEAYPMTPDVPTMAETLAGERSDDDDSESSRSSAAP